MIQLVGDLFVFTTILSVLEEKQTVCFAVQNYYHAHSGNYIRCIEEGEFLGMYKKHSIIGSYIEKALINIYVWTAEEHMFFYHVP